MAHCSFHTCSNNQCALIAFSEVAVRCLCRCPICFFCWAFLSNQILHRYICHICDRLNLVFESQGCAPCCLIYIHFKPELFLLLLRTVAPCSSPHVANHLNSSPCSVQSLSATSVFFRQTVVQYVVNQLHPNRYKRSPLRDRLRYSTAQLRKAMLNTEQTQKYKTMSNTEMLNTGQTQKWQ